jgi:hypothetical protein
VAHRVYIIIAFVIALAATGIGWSQTLLYKITPVVPLALWFPLTILTGARELEAVALSFVQFPLFATAFALGIRRWPVVHVLGGLVAVYGLLAGSAYAIVAHK